MQVIYAEVKIVVADGYEPEKVFQELEYTFTHPGVLSTNVEPRNYVEE